MGAKLFEEADKNRLISRAYLFSMLFLVFLIPVVALLFTDDWGITIILLFFAMLYAVENLFFAMGSAMGFVNARKIDAGMLKNAKVKQFSNIVEEMKIASAYRGTIDTYVIEDPSINAMAVSRGNKAAVAVTTGALEKLNREELSGVIGHEIAHINNADSDIKLTAFIAAGILLAYFRVLSRFRVSSDNRKGAGVLYIILILLAVFGYVFGLLMFFAISRRRESLADVESVRFTRDKEAMVNALKKIKKNEKMDVPETASSLFFANPLSPIDSRAFFSLFQTHPPLDERIKNLEAL